jgi:CRISPR-associated protein Cmx8
LLHFWPFVAPIYVPAVTGRDGEREFAGFALVIPDVADLEEFVRTWEQVARERGPEAAGYRPRDAVVDVAAEAGLDVARRAFLVVGRREGAALTRPWLTAVDVFHVEKDGNNVRTRSVAPRRPAPRSSRRLRPRAHGATGVRCFVASASPTSSIPLLDPRTGWVTGFGRLCATSARRVDHRTTRSFGTTAASHSRR